MKRTALVVLAAAAALAAGAYPAAVAAHGGEPDDEAQAVAMALKRPLVVEGSASLTIVHVQKGCHSWSVGKGMPAAGVKVLLRRGQRLTVVNRDLDTHKLVRLAGPRIPLGKPLAMNDRVTLTFSKPGVYKLRTMKMETPGMPEVKTVGPDHVLAMLVVVR